MKLFRFLKNIYSLVTCWGRTLSELEREDKRRKTYHQRGLDNILASAEGYIEKAGGNVQKAFDECLKDGMLTGSSYDPVLEELGKRLALIIDRPT